MGTGGAVGEPALTVHEPLAWVCDPIRAKGKSTEATYFNRW